MEEIKHTHTVIRSSIQKVQQAIERLSVVGPALDGIKGHFEATVGEDDQQSHAQVALNILSRVRDELDQVPPILDAAINSASNLVQDI